MLENSLTAFKSQIQAIKVRVTFLEFIHHAQRLQVVLEPAVLAHALVERVLACVSEWGVAKVMGKADRLRQRLVQAQGERNRTRDLGHLDGMRHARAIQIPFVVDEYLRLVDQPPERVGMDNPIAVALELTAKLRLGFRVTPAARLRIIRSIRGERAHPKCAASVRVRAAAGEAALSTASPLLRRSTRRKR